MYSETEIVGLIQEVFLVVPHKKFHNFLKIPGLTKQKGSGWNFKYYSKFHDSKFSNGPQSKDLDAIFSILKKFIIQAMNEGAATRKRTVWRDDRIFS